MQVLHAGNTNKNAFKALIAAEYSGVEVNLVQNFEMGVSNKTPEFLKMTLLERFLCWKHLRVPYSRAMLLLVMVRGDKLTSTFSSGDDCLLIDLLPFAVTRSKDDNPLFGSTLIDNARIEQWIDFASMEVDANIAKWLYPRVGLSVYLPPAEEAAIASLKRALDSLSTHLASNTYLVGHSVTLADIIMTCNLYTGFCHIMTKSFTSEFPHIERQRPVHLLHQKKLATQPKESKPKAKAEPKKETIKEAEKPPLKAEAAEEEEAPKPKPKNPLDLLPPSKMVLDDWKRLYSNTKTNFREDSGTCTIPKDTHSGSATTNTTRNTVSFVTMNKVGGFLQRMDLARKYAFGKMLVIGAEPPFKVKGLCLFRGQQIPQFVLDECYDMELYEWKKVDITDEAQKERVSQMIEDCEPFEGEPLLDAKCFK
ncbi:Elongation factor 1-gamma [Hibiscus syriacus]|uniref:Elongation factor 1-gamma n=1 Tax=Hibiscus syriacus TaxID=106335 RepID=A0A6A3B9X4_HIBSY|nr:Elongation factor 1-gamma [Hibiscus syriacus]